jgi:hypothetical protein
MLLNYEENNEWALVWESSLNPVLQIESVGEDGDDDDILRSSID